MKKILLKSMIAITVFGMTTNAFAADIPGAADAKAGDIGRHETSSGVNEWMNPENGVYGIHVFAADENYWDSQFFWVFADAVVPAGTPFDLKFEYRKAEGSGVVKFNAQGHADPHAYVNDDGWATLEATEEWQSYEGSFEATGEIRTFAVNASIAREDGTLYMRNIVIEVNYDEVVVTKETDADAAEIGEAPIIDISEVPYAQAHSATVDYAKIAGDTTAAAVASAIFVGRDATNDNKPFVLNAVKYGDDKVFAFLSDTSVVKNAWDVQFFAHWEQTGVSGIQKVLSFDYKVDFEAAGGWNVSHDDIATGAGNQGAKWGAIQPTTEWQHYADTITENWFFELHLSGRKTDKDFQNWGDAYNIFLKNVELYVDGVVVAKSNDLNEVLGTEAHENWFIEDNIKYQQNYNNSVIVLSNSYTGDVNIPSSVIHNGITYSVTSISKAAFMDCNNLTSVVIPNTVTIIGNSAFMNCGSLTSVIIPNSVTSIDNNAFSGCSSLVSITIPNSVTSIGNSAFMNCGSLTSVIIPNSVTSIDNNAFSGCSSLVSITIPNSVTSIGNSAFMNCGSLTSVIIPNSVTSIDNKAFSGCSSLSSITIPNSVTSLGTAAFRGCGNLTSMTIPNGVTKIGDYTFFGCGKLQSITIGESVNNIGVNVFAGCDLKNIECKGLIPPKVSNELLTDNIVNDAYLYMNATLTCPKNAKFYTSMQPWCNFDFAEGTFAGRVDTIVVNRVDTIYLDTIYSIINKTDTVYRVDTIYSVVNKKDTIFSVDTIYSVINKTDTILNSRIDTIYSVINKTDTVYVVSQSASRFNVKAVTTDVKKGLAIGTGRYEKDDMAEITAISNYGYHFTKWSDGNTDNPRFVSVSSDCEFKAEFEVNNYNVLAAANEQTMGTVEGANTYAYLSRTQLKAIPNSGYQFKEWSDGETANPRNILIYSDTTFTAVFVANELTSIGDEIANAINIYAHHNTIIVENATEEICVYDAMGRLIVETPHCDVSTEIRVNAAGLYIVKVGNVAKRVMINE